MNQATSYTPGPWKMKPTGFELLIMAEDTPIAEMLWNERASGDIGSIRRVNARLIAAAPEMYETVKRLHEVFCNKVIVFVNPDTKVPDKLGIETWWKAHLADLVAKIKGDEQKE